MAELTTSQLTIEGQLSERFASANSPVRLLSVFVP